MQVVVRNGVQVVEETWKLQDEQILEYVMAQQRCFANDNPDGSIATQHHL